MIMILFGALSAGTKTYLLCRSDRQAFTSAFCNTLPVGKDTLFNNNEDTLFNNNNTLLLKRDPN